MPESTEWTFAADVATWMTTHLRGKRNLPFTEAKVEMKSRGSLKRRDVSLYDRDRKIALTGEIRFPDARGGQTPYDGKLVGDARSKARRAKSRFFFTWNVNRLVLWATDEEHEIRPPFDVVSLRHGAEVELASVQRSIRDEFIPRFLAEYAAIYRGEETTGVLPLDKRFIGRLETIAHDWGELCGKVGANVELAHYQRTDGLPYPTYYSPHLVNLVGARYREDIVRFGYQFDPLANLPPLDVTG